MKSPIGGDEIRRHLGHGITTPTIREGDVEHVIPIVRPLHPRLLSDAPFGAERDCRIETLVLILTEAVGGIQAAIQIDHITVVIAVDSRHVLAQLVRLRVHHTCTLPHLLGQVIIVTASRNSPKLRMLRHRGKGLAAIAQVAVAQCRIAVNLVGSDLHAKIERHRMLFCKDIVVDQRATNRVVHCLLVGSVEQAAIGQGT